MMFSQLLSYFFQEKTAVPAQNEENTSKNNELEEKVYENDEEKIHLNQGVSSEAGITEEKKKPAVTPFSVATLPLDVVFLVFEYLVKRQSSAREVHRILLLFASLNKAWFVVSKALLDQCLCKVCPDEFARPKYSVFFRSILCELLLGDLVFLLDRASSYLVSLSWNRAPGADRRVIEWYENACVYSVNAYAYALHTFFVTQQGSALAQREEINQHFKAADALVPELGHEKLAPALGIISAVFQSQNRRLPKVRPVKKESICSIS